MRCSDRNWGYINKASKARSRRVGGSRSKLIGVRKHLSHKHSAIRLRSCLRSDRPAHCQRRLTRTRPTQLPAVPANRLYVTGTRVGPVYTRNGAMRPKPCGNQGGNCTNFERWNNYSQRFTYQICTFKPQWI